MKEVDGYLVRSTYPKFGLWSYIVVDQIWVLPSQHFWLFNVLLPCTTIAVWATYHAFYVICSWSFLTIMSLAYFATSKGYVFMNPIWVHLSMCTTWCHSARLFISDVIFRCRLQLLSTRMRALGLCSTLHCTLNVALWEIDTSALRAFVNLMHRFLRGHMLEGWLVFLQFC